MAYDDSTDSMGNRGSGPGGRPRRILRVLVPAAATVGGLVVLAAVAPTAGFLAQLLVSLIGGVALAVAVGGGGTTIDDALEVRDTGGSGPDGPLTAKGFVLGYLWSVTVFALVAMVVTAVFLF